MLLEQSLELCQYFDLCASQAKLSFDKGKAIHFACQSEAFDFSLQTLIHGDQSVGLDLPRLIQGDGFTVVVAGGGAGGCCHGFNLAQPEHRSIANRKKDSF